MSVTREPGIEPRTHCLTNRHSANLLCQPISMKERNIKEEKTKDKKKI